jgi:hypothetical protein
MAESIDLSSQGKPGTSSEPGEGPHGVKSWSTPVSSIDDDHNDPNGNPKKTYLTGWRLHITTLAFESLPEYFKDIELTHRIQRLSRSVPAQLRGFDCQYQFGFYHQ